MVAMVLVACVGDSPSSNDGGIPAGEEGGPCYADATCNKNKPLVCASKLCVNIGLDGGGDAGDASTSDASLDVVRPPCDFPVAPTTFQVACGVSQCPVPIQKCCFDSPAGACIPVANNCGSNSLECDDKADCQPSEVCCLTSSLGSLRQCPVKSNGAGVGKCAAQCAGVTLCGKGEVCNGGKTCVQLEIPGSQVIGACL